MGLYDALVLHQPIGVAVLLLATITLVLATVVGLLFAGRVRYDAAWGAALTGLIVLRLRGGEVHYTLNDGSSGVFLVMLLELVLLAGVAAAIWAGLHIIRERGATSPALKRWLELPRAADRNVDRPRTRESLQQKFLHLGVSAGVCGVVVFMASRNDAPMQTTLSVALGAWLGAIAAYATVPVRPAAWAWAGPIVAAVVGYVAAFLLTGEARLAVGEPGGPLWPLALPLPLEWVGGDPGGTDRLRAFTDEAGRATCRSRSEIAQEEGPACAAGPSSCARA